MYACNVCPYININVYSQQWSAAGIDGLVVVERALTDSCTMGRKSPSASQLIGRLRMEVFTMGRREERTHVVRINMLYYYIQYSRQSLN